MWACKQVVVEWCIIEKVKCKWGVFVCHGSWVWVVQLQLLQSCQAIAVEWHVCNHAHKHNK